jgi:hypothetical protein
VRGVGWVILFQDPATHWLTNHWVTLHHEGVPVGFRPLLVMDVWDHAFMRDYKATERGKYIEAFFRNIDWRMIERRLQEPSARRLRPEANVGDVTGVAVERGPRVISARTRPPMRIACVRRPAPLRGQALDQGLIDGRVRVG